jgi:DNA-binding winged helix-turn-helix (wHTH) protein
LRLRFGDFVFEPEARQLFRAGEEVHLQPKTFELLDLLVSARPKALGKQAIRGHLWPDVVVGDASLTMAVAELRAVLGDDAKEPRYVRTVYGFGYAFAGECVEERPAGPPPVPAGALTPRVLWERRVIPLVEGENVLGRDEQATVRIEAPGVSRRHALVRVAGGKATLEDLGSKNGTFLAGKPVQSPTPLTDGATFSLGRVPLVFRISPEVRSTLTDHRG